MMDSEEIERLLPHRSPFLFVDRVLEVEPGRRVQIEYDVPHDAFWVPGHFPGEPIMPGVLIGEVMAQAAALIYLTVERDRAGSSVYLLGLDKLRLRRPVRPGETLQVVVEVERKRSRIWRFEGSVTVSGERTADAVVLATIGDIDVAG